MLNQLNFLINDKILGTLNQQIVKNINSEYMSWSKWEEFSPNILKYINIRKNVSQYILYTKQINPVLLR